MAFHAPGVLAVSIRNGLLLAAYAAALVAVWRRGRVAGPASALVEVGVVTPPRASEGQRADTSSEAPAPPALRGS